MNSNFFKMPERIFGVSSSLIKLFLLPLVVVIVFLVSLGLVIIPKIDSIISLGGTISKVRSEIKVIDGKRAYLSSVNQDELVKNEDYLSSAVLQEKNSYLLVGVIRNIVEDFDFGVKSFLISPIELKDDKSSLKVSDKNVATKLPVSVVLEGPQEKVTELLISIERSLPVMFIDKIEISNRGEISEINLTVSSYYISNNQNIVSGNLTLNDLIPTQEESDLLSKISQFKKDDSLVKTLIDSDTQGKSYVEYSRNNPFTL